MNTILKALKNDERIESVVLVYLDGIQYARLVPAWENDTSFDIPVNVVFEWVELQHGISQYTYA